MKNFVNLKRTSSAFSIAEALITLMIVSLILAAVIPVVSKRQMTTDAMWKYAPNNSDIFYGLGASQTAIIGHSSLPQASTGARLVLVTPLDNLNDTIHRSLISFYQQSASGIVNVGKMSFDQKGNIAVGKESMRSNTTGSLNVAFGDSVLYTNSTGERNTGFGYQTLYRNSAGSNNTALGYGALFNSTSSENTAVGSNAALGTSSGAGNTAIGFNSLRVNSTGGFNTAVGWNSLERTTVGENTAVGYQSLRNNATGVRNVALGFNSLRSSTSSDNTAIGHSALSSSSSGDGNTAVGSSALALNDGQSGNTAIGAGALSNDTAGFANTAVGQIAMVANTVGDRNTAVGQRAMRTNTTGTWNTAVGHASLDMLESGSNNAALGVAALRNVTSGSFNVGIGTDACTAVTNGSSNICIGYFAGPTSNSTSKLYIDNRQTNASLIYGDFATREIQINGTFRVTGNSTVMGTSYTNGSVVVTSDKRLKNVLGEDNSGLEKILKLNIKKFTYKKQKDKTVHSGVIAQELKMIMPNAVKKGPDGYLYIDPSEILFALVNSVKQLYSKVQNNTSRIVKLEQENTYLKKKLDAQDKKIAEIEKILKSK